MGEAAAVGVSEEARDDDSIPRYAIQHSAHCLRQAALIHLERMWADNRFTREGQVVHLATHEPGAHRVRRVQRVTGLPLVSRRLGIAGVADLSSSRPM
jgi:CRISPR-associated exonuclease Cas4